MKLKNKSLIILLLIVPLFGAFSFDSETLNRITFVNKTGAEIWYIFLSPGDSEEWGFDILGSSRSIEPKSKLSFYISYPDYENLFDIMAINEDGDTFILYDEPINDDEEARIVISTDDLDSESPDFDLLTVDFFNDASPIHYFFVSPQDSGMWGVDMLDDETILEPDEILSLLVPAREGDISYDVMCIDEDNDEYQFTLNVNPDYADEEGIIDIAVEYSDLVD